MMRPCVLVLAVLAALALPARALDLALCVDKNDWAPYTFAARDGTLQVLARMAAARGGDKIGFVALPWKRCQAEVAAGKLQGMVGAADIDDALHLYAYPHLNGRLDSSRALQSTSIVLVRRTGSSVGWDGNVITGLKGPVLYVLGYDDVADHLRQRGLNLVDGGANNNELNADKIMAGRASMMAIYDNDARLLVARPEYRGKLEILAPPLGVNDYYLAFNRHYYDSHSEQVERFWTDMRSLRQSAAYRDAVKNIR